MSISSTSRKAGPFTGNGITVSYSFSFKVFTAADVLVVQAVTATGVETTLALATNYTVALNADQNANPGGTVTMLVAPPTGTTLVLSSQVANLQPVDLTNNGGFYPKVINDALDRSTIQVQQLAEKVSRAVLVSLTSGTDPAALLTGINTAVGVASTSATTATTQAGIATTQAGNASASAAAAAASAATISPTATGAALISAASPAAARTALGAGATGGSLFVATTVATALAALGLPSVTGFFYKADTQSVGFTKTGAGTLNIKAGTTIDVLGTVVTFAAATAVVMPSLTAGTDYAIYACQDGTVRADSNFTNPTGYTTANSRLIGGFHYGLVASGTTVAGGSFNTAGSPVGGGMVWTQTDVDNIAGINVWSLWDLKWRPDCSNPRGMVLVNGRCWVDIYLCSTDTAANGTSKYNSNIASGTVLPKVPAVFGGNGTLTYSTLTWWEASELARANQKRLILASEFYDAAFGVTENQSIDATASTYPNTQRNAGYTSKYGIEQAAGVHYTWGQDSAGSASAWVANGGRGQSYNNSVVRVLLGGARAGGAVSGSRCSKWDNVTSSSFWNIGLRAACDHMWLV